MAANRSDIRNVWKVWDFMNKLIINLRWDTW